MWTRHHAKGQKKTHLQRIAGFSFAQAAATGNEHIWHFVAAAPHADHSITCVYPEAEYSVGSAHLKRRDEFLGQKDGDITHRGEPSDIVWLCPPTESESMYQAH